MKFPQPGLLEDNVVRLPKGISMRGLDPPISQGSVVLLEDVVGIPDPPRDAKKTGWERSIYALRRGTEFIMGNLERDGNQYALRAGGSENGFAATFGLDEFSQLRRIAGAAVPV